MNLGGQILTPSNDEMLNASAILNFGNWFVFYSVPPVVQLCLSEGRRGVGGGGSEGARTG